MLTSKETRCTVNKNTTTERRNIHEATDIVHVRHGPRRRDIQRHRFRDPNAAVVCSVDVYVRSVSMYFVLLE